MQGVRWVRLFYLYPETLDDALIELLANHPRVVPYVDMPLQHAADAMLKRMRRGHGKDRQKRVVERLRETIPDLTFRTAFIVGHPGETDAEFDELCEFVRVGALRARRRLPLLGRRDVRGATRSTARCRALVAANRAPQAHGAAAQIAREKNRALVGRELDVLVEGPSEEHELVMKGRHAGQAPEIDGRCTCREGEARAGEMRRVRITQASDYDLVGELLDDGAARRRAREPRAAQGPRRPAPNRAGSEPRRR